MQFFATVYGNLKDSGLQPCFQASAYAIGFGKGFEDLKTKKFKDKFGSTLLITVISNSNWTKWSTIQRVIGQVISKLPEREARGQLKITSMITP